MAAYDIVKIIYFLVYVIVVIVYAAPTSKLPEGFTQCKKSDSDFDECVRDGIQRSMPYLAKGIPSLNINKIDPLNIVSMNIDHSFSGELVNMELRFFNLNVYNLKYAQIIKAHYDPINYTMYTELQFPESIKMEGNYELYGNVLFLPLIGEGKCKIDLDLTQGVGNYQLQPVKNKGLTYLEIVNMKWDFMATNLSMNFDNLYNENDVIGYSINTFLNENWERILFELRPDLEDVFTQVHMEIVQQFLIRVPLNELFVD